MKVLMINGSPRKDSNTGIALAEMEKIFAEEGIEVVNMVVGNKVIRGCVACNRCSELGKCVFDDQVNEAAAIFEEADGLVIASPVYWGSANGTLISGVVAPPSDEEYEDFAPYFQNIFMSVSPTETAETEAAE